MTAALPIPARPIFANIAEALAWYAQSAEQPSVTAPPVDAIGDEFVDAYLATVFAALRHMPGVATKIAHLNDKAAQLDRSVMSALSAAGAANETERAQQIAWAEIRMTWCQTMRKWASELQEVSAAHAVAGGAP